MDNRIYDNVGHRPGTVVVSNNDTYLDSLGKKINVPAFDNPVYLDGSHSSLSDMMKIANREYDLGKSVVIYSLHNEPEEFLTPSNIMNNNSTILNATIAASLMSQNIVTGVQEKEDAERQQMQLLEKHEDVSEQVNEREGSYSDARRIRYGNNKAHRSATVRKNQSKLAKASKKRNRQK